MNVNKNNLSLTEKQKQLSRSLFKIGAISFGEFKLKLHDRLPKAPLSPYYINLRILQRFPDIKKMALTVYLDLIKDFKFDLLCGIPLAATPLASSLSDYLKVGMITPRLTEKTHGNGAKADGFLEEDKNKRVLVIDDLITSADSKFEVIKILKNLGLKVAGVAVLLDREQGGKEELLKKGYHLYAAIKWSQMLAYYLESKIISQNTYKDIIERSKKLNQYLKVQK